MADHGPRIAPTDNRDDRRHLAVYLFNRAADALSWYAIPVHRIWHSSLNRAYEWAARWLRPTKRPS